MRATMFALVLLLGCSNPQPTEQSAAKAFEGAKASASGHYVASAFEGAVASGELE